MSSTRKTAIVTGASQGIGRALVKDILSQSASQGASTITEQFVKNALEAEGSRTVLEKFREAALAYKLDKHWTKSKILTEYLNTIYFGEGAYGIEAAAQTYFGAAHPGCGTEAEPCAAVLEPWEAAARVELLRRRTSGVLVLGLPSRGNCGALGSGTRAPASERGSLALPPWRT